MCKLLVWAAMISQARGRMDITTPFYREETEAREGECKLLIRCFVCTATLNSVGYFFPKKISQIHISAHTKQAGFEVLP